MVMKNPFSLSRFVLPVFHAESTDGPHWQLLPRMIYGSCFPIGPEYMLTARHVAETIEGSSRILAIGWRDPGNDRYSGLPVTDTEVFAHDVALLRVALIPPEAGGYFEALHWRDEDLSGFDAVRCWGYAYGAHRVESRDLVVPRCFDGIVSAHLYELLPLGLEARGEKPFPAYELSFQVPRGLSGAPLVHPVGDIKVCGLVIGNSEHKMLVFQSEETEEAGTKTSYKHWESLSMGVAVTATALYRLKSSMLGMTIGDYLAANGRLARARL
jgi:hypothetical protein